MLSVDSLMCRGRGATERPRLGQVLINWRLLSIQGAVRGHSGLEQVKGARDLVQERDDWLSVQKPLKNDWIESSVDGCWERNDHCPAGTKADG